MVTLGSHYVYIYSPACAFTVDLPSSALQVLGLRLHSTTLNFLICFVCPVFFVSQFEESDLGPRAVLSCSTSELPPSDTPALSAEVLIPLV